MDKEEITHMIGRLRSLSESSRILLRNHLGEYFDMQKSNIRMLMLYVAPENAPSMKTDPVFWQNLFFVSGVYCRIPTGQHSDSPEKLEKKLAEMTVRKFNEQDAADNRIADILTLRTGKRGTLYPALAQLIRGIDADIDCVSLFNDLQYWETDPGIQEKWARAYINVLKKENKNEFNPEHC